MRRDVVLNDVERWARRFPAIRWGEPQRIVLTTKLGWACRICIAERGLRATELDRVYEAYDDCAEHILARHILDRVEAQP